ncbi:YcxB family protein [Streptomyces virginiae]|uniref:YcxB family protein n=1 Tax=Streptomyces virginiae TaxID=1961 RepID=UPI0034528618
MNTTGGAEPAVGAQVEAYFGPRPADAREALRWQSRKTARGRVRMLLWLGPPLVPAALGAVRGIAPEHLLVLAVLAPPVGWYAAHMSLDRRVYRLYEWAARHREYRCTLSDTGLETRLPDGTSSLLLWSECEAFAETRNLFLLLPKGKGAPLWLPKRAALTGAELARIRAFLERNLRRF